MQFLFLEAIDRFYGGSAVARIPEEELERLKLEVDLAALVRSKGIELKTHGENLLGHCPFHDDRTPSLVITPSKNLWHCMGACSMGGTVIDWVMKAEGVSFRHAVEILREGVDLSSAIKATVPRLALPLDPNGDEQKLMREVLAYYKETLKKSPEAIDYLKKRKIYSEEAVEKFNLGYSNRSLGLRLPQKSRVLGNTLRTKLMEIGICRESGHEHFRGSVVFPVTKGDNVTEIYGRKTVPNLKSGTQYHTYLPGPHEGIWNEECVNSSEIILCESIIDALSFWCHGFKNVTASYGTEGFTDDHLDLFLKGRVQSVLIAYDRDEAGDRGAEKVAALLAANGIEAWRIEFPKTMDANDYVQKMVPESAALEVVIKQAKLLSKPKNPRTIERPSEEFLAEKITPPTSSLLEASPVEVAVEQPPAAIEATPCETRGEDVLISLGEREYRVRGLRKNLSFDVMRVNIRVAVEDKYHVDTLDLYQAKARVSYVSAAALELEIGEEIIKKDLGKVLCKLEELQEAQIRKTLEGAPAKKEMPESEKEAALAFLRNPELLSKILTDFDRCGVIGEEVNKLVGYLAAVSRKLDDPLAVMIQSSSAAGKSSLMEAVLAMMPEEDKVKYSAMTGQSLFYMGEHDLKHRILAIAEEQGVSQAAYALKLLQSEGEISIASTGKDSTTGKLITHQYRVEGPVMIFLTTTAIEVDEELLNRCVVLTVNETREQTKAIHTLQRKKQTLEGMLAREERSHILKVHQNAQRLLRPLLVVNPYAEKLTFLDSSTRTRRDHVKYLNLISTIALLHQYQRETKWTMHRGKAIEYIEVEKRDIETANHLCHQILGRSLDELPPQTRRLLSLVSSMVEENCAEKKIAKEDYRFTRRDVREASRWSDFQVQVHMDRLQRMEYVIAHRGGRGQTFLYELAFQGKIDDASIRMMGLTDQLDDLTPSFKHFTQSFEGSYSPHMGAIKVGPGSLEIGQDQGASLEKGESEKFTH